jgi:hypothetical protein
MAKILECHHNLNNSYIPMEVDEESTVHVYSTVRLPISNLFCDLVWLTWSSLTILSGAPFTVAVIQIPQRYQAVGDNSPIRAGVNLLPFTLLLSVGSIFASISTSKSRAPPIFVFLVGAILQTVGCALMSTLGVEVGRKAYGYEVILALGLGMNLGMGIILTPQLIRGDGQCRSNQSFYTFFNLSLFHSDCFGRSYTSPSARWGHRPCSHNYCSQLLCQI